MAVINGNIWYVRGRILSVCCAYLSMEGGSIKLREFVVFRTIDNEQCIC